MPGAEKGTDLFHVVDRPDVVFYCGCAITPPWDPRSTALGGSEQAVVGLSCIWAQRGRTVTVYSAFDFLLSDTSLGGQLTWGGVQWKHAQEFDPRATYRNLVLWRLDGTRTGLRDRVVADNLIVDVHDNMPPQIRLVLEHADRVNHLMVRSGFHLAQCLEQAGAHGGQKGTECIRRLAQVQPNGVTVPEPDRPHEPREPYRFVYTSCYSRGLLPLLVYTWPLIFARCPQAELHVFYGLNSIRDQTYQNMLATALAQPGVMDHGRQTRAEVARHKMQSGFHLYWTDTPVETDCMTIRESLALGCIPLLRPTAVFREREGLFWEPPEGVTAVKEQYALLAGWVLEQCEKDKAGCFDEMREALKGSPLLVSWGEVASRWPLLPLHTSPTWEATVTDRGTC